MVFIVGSFCAFDRENYLTLPHDTVQPAKTGRRQASAGFLKAIFCKAAHQGVTAQVCPSAS